VSHLARLVCVASTKKDYLSYHYCCPMKSIESIKKFHFRIGGYFATQFDVIITHNKASYCEHLFNIDFATRQEKEISKDQMELFLSKLNQLNIIGWDNEYHNPLVLDGIQWELEITYNKTNTKKIYGSNMYPNSEPNSVEKSPEFNCNS